MDNGKWINKKFFVSLSILHFTFYIFLVGCGYKPSIDYQNRLIGKKVKVEVNINIKNPRESIYLKDAVIDAVYSILDKEVCFENCDTILKISPRYSSIQVLDYDENGYPILYRSKVILNTTLIDKNGKKRVYSVSGIYDFRVESQSVLNDEAKLNAYKNASINALNKLFALISKDGVNYDN